MHNTKANESPSSDLRSIRELKGNEIRAYERWSNNENKIQVKNKTLNEKIEKLQRDFNLITKLDTASKRNLAIEFDEMKVFSFSCWIKENQSLIKHFGLSYKGCLSKAQINLILAEKIAKSLLSINDFKSIRDSYLNEIDLNVYKNFRSSIEFFVTEEIKEILYSIVLESKKSDSVNLAASNAITLLNKTGFLFSNKDLSRIKIPNADLSWGLFINTNFESSNLCGVNFSQAHIYDSNFRNCSMLNVNFGKNLIFGLEEDIEIAKFSPCGRFLAIATEFKLFLYDAKINKKLAQLTKNKRIASLLFSDDGNYLIASGNSKPKLLWDTSSKLQISQFSKNCISCCFSPCNNYLCLIWKINKKQNILKIHNIKTNKIVNEIEWLDPKLKFASFSPSMENLITWDDHTLSIWNFHTKTIINQIRQLDPNKVSISFNRKWVAILGEDAKIGLYDFEKLELHLSFINASYLMFSYCGRYIALYTAINLSTKIFNLSKKKEYLENFQEKILDFFPNEKYALAKSKSLSLELLKLSSNAEINNKLLWKESINAASFSGDSQFFALLTAQGWIYIFITENQKLLSKYLASRSSFVSHIAWSYTVFATTYFESIRFWNIYDGSIFKEISTLGNPLGIEFSSDGKKVISSSYDFGEMFDIDSSGRILLLKNDNRKHTSWFWSQWENFIISVDYQGIRIFRIENTELSVVSELNVNFSSAIQSVFREYLVSYRGILTVWNLGDLTKITKAKEILHNSEWILNSIIWSPDSKKIIAGDNEGNLIVWDIDTGNEVKKIKAHQKRISLINISKEEHLISCGFQETIKLWEFNSLH